MKSKGSFIVFIERYTERDRPSTLTRFRLRYEEKKMFRRVTIKKGRNFTKGG